MKFENGCWIFAEGYTCFPATHVYFTKKSENAVNLTVPTHHITGKGDTLGGIAAKYRTSVSRLCRLNGIRANKTLKIGERIRYK